MQQLRPVQHLRLASHAPALLLVLAIACTAYAGNTTCNSNDWQTASAEELQLDPALMNRLVQHAREELFPNLHALIVVKDDKIAMEEYFGDYDASTPHYIASVTKSAGSLLIGIAMDQGLLPGLEEGVLDMRLPDLFPEYKDIFDADPRKKEIRLRHVLTMTAGFEWDELSHPYDDPRNDWARVRDASDPVRFILEQPLTHDPGEVFYYSGGLSTLLAHLLESKTKTGAADFAKQYLFEPLGIHDYEWWHLEGGLIDTPGGLTMRPRDMAKLGRLCLDAGMWNGKPIVSRAWITESTREQVMNEGSPNYGFQWWCGDFHYGGRSVYLYAASGHGGQKIFVVPKFRLVVVLTHTVFGNPLGEFHNNAILSRYILPAADPQKLHDEPVVLDSATLARYAGTYSSSNGSMVIQLEDGKLKATAERSETMYLVPMGGIRFRGTVQGLVDVEFLFDITDEGVVKGGRTTFGFRNEPFHRVPDDFENQ